MRTGGRVRRLVAQQSGRLRSERGQMLVLFALLVLPVTFVLGAIAVDASIWQSERRGAQKDADLSALAGALELLRTRDQALAENAAINYADENDEAGNGISPAASSDANAPNTVVVDDACYPGNTALPLNSVGVNLDHESQNFFSGVFGLDVAPDIGAHAKACAGAAQSPNGLVPIQMDLTQAPCFENLSPIFGALCEIEYGSEHDNKDRGVLDLQASGDYCSEASGSGDLEDLIEWGADGSCFINTADACDPTNKGPWYDCVAVQRGNPAKVGRAFERRIAREGACDDDGNGYESFEETVTLVVDDADPSLDVYEARDCEPDVDGDQISPRLISIIILEEPPVLPSGNTGYPIYAFAGFYVSGCAGEPGITNEDDLDRFCDLPGGGGAMSAPATGSSAQFVSYPSEHRCGHKTASTCTPVPTDTPLPSSTPTRTPTVTNTPGAATPTATATATPNGGGGGGVGHTVVYGRFVNLIFAGHEAGPPTESTTLFSISLVE